MSNTRVHLIRVRGPFRLQRIPQPVGAGITRGLRCFGRSRGCGGWARFDRAGFALALAWSQSQLSRPQRPRVRVTPIAQHRIIDVVVEMTESYLPADSAWGRASVPASVVIVAIALHLDPPVASREPSDVAWGLTRGSGREWIWPSSCSGAPACRIERRASPLPSTYRPGRGRTARGRGGSGTGHDGCPGPSTQPAGRLGGPQPVPAHQLARSSL